MIFVYSIFFVALLGAELALLEYLERLAMLTRLLEELQKIYCIQKSSEFNFQEVRQGLNKIKTPTKIPQNYQGHFASLLVTLKECTSLRYGY